MYVEYGIFKPRYLASICYCLHVYLIENIAMGYIIDTVHLGPAVLNSG